MATIFTNVGKAQTAGRFTGDSTGTFNRIGWGTGAGTAAAVDTTLFTEAAETRATATLSRTTTAVTNDTFQAAGTLTSTSSQTITNAGLFDTATGGNLFVHADHTGIPLQSGDSIQYTFKTQYS